ncbi:MAG TPA: extracellular solute-binding protein [Candidatus Pelethocola excrementipullorum]|nr:extracellular solute-binding protein [Candidatus Pelethocola excrementipullorum]
MRKKNFKKLQAVLLAGICTVNLAACGTADTGGKTSGQTDTKETAKVESGEKNLYGYNDPIKLKVGLTFNSDFDWQAGESEEDNAWWNLYKEMGYDMEVMYSVDGSQAETKLTTAITSGNYPDILGISGADLVKYAETGVIADISDVFEEYASDELKEYLNYGDGGALNSAKVDGVLYGIPKVEDKHGAAMMMFIRQDWLDSLGLEIPTTMEELKEVARAFTEDDPDGNGQDDTYGLALNGKEGFSFWSGIQAFFEGYGACPGYWNGQFSFIEKDGEVVWGGALADEMKAGLTDLKEMYDNGSLAKGFGTMDYNQVTQDAGAGKCGIYFAPHWGAMVPAWDAMKSDPQAHIVSAEIPNGMGEGSSKAYVPTIPDVYYAISSKCENPEALIKMLNLSVQKLIYPADANEFNMYNGKAGEYSGWKACLTPTASPDEAITNVLVEHEAIKTGEKDGLTTSQLTNVEAMEAYYEAVENGTLEEKLAADDPLVKLGVGFSTTSGDELGGGMTMVKMIEKGNFNYSAYNYVPTGTMSSKFSTLDKMALETIVKIISGDSVDTYDTFLKSWEALGGAEVTKEAQEWYDQNK